jgi:hypothetical protein
LNDYITGKTNKQPEEKIAFTDCLNLASVDTAALEMESLAFQNTRCKDPVMHLLLSWRENETPTIEQIREAVSITLGELNLSQCQAVYSLHQNTDNLHLHICVNRIDPETAKAITPAGGWTRRAMEHAARKIEHAQGWQTEENTWSEIGENGEVIQKPDTSKTRIRQETKDAENQTGEKSAIRKAQEALIDSLKNISSWDDLHALMKSNGMEYCKKGSGAIIHVGEIIIKASGVSRKLSLTNLEKRFGVFHESQTPTVPIPKDACKISAPEPLGKSNDNANWRAYIAERGEYGRNTRRNKDQILMTQRKEREELKRRHSEERSALSSMWGKGYSPQYLREQRITLSSKQAYERAVQKAYQKSLRNELYKQSRLFASYEEWLRSHELNDAAYDWRHRKDKKHIRLECPNETNSVTQNARISGILGFTMTQTRRGAKFFRDATPNQAAFIDRGKVIIIYENSDDSLLAALQLAQSKWGGVQISGTDEYKRKCVEIAVKNGIRIANSELQGLAEEFERKNRPPVSPDMARRLIGHDVSRLKYEHQKTWRSYDEHKKELSEFLNTEPHKPKLFGLQKWKSEHSKWAARRDMLAAQIVSDLETMGVKYGAGNAENEAEYRHGNYEKFALEEALRQNPAAAKIIREDDAMREREERAKREAEEAEEREREKNYKLFRMAIRELAAKYGKNAFIVTSAQDGRNYGGLLLGTVERDGHYYAVQDIGDDHVILHGAEKDDLPDIQAMTGKKVEIRNDGGRVSSIAEEIEHRERNRGWSR